MLKDLDFDEIVSFFKVIPESQMGNIQKVQIYGLALERQERMDKEEAVNNVLKGVRKHNIVNTTIVSEDIAIIEVIDRWNGEEEHTFIPVVKGRSMTEVSDTLDYALIIALSSKYGQGTHAPSMIYNMLRMDKLEEQ